MVPIIIEHNWQSNTFRTPSINSLNSFSFMCIVPVFGICACFVVVGFISVARSQIGQTPENKKKMKQIKYCCEQQKTHHTHSAYLVINISNDYTVAVKAAKTTSYKRTKKHKEWGERNIYSKKKILIYCSRSVWYCMLYNSSHIPNNS